VLQEREFERVGGAKTIKVDVRLICATNKNLLEEVRAGRFREDLYYRINVIYLKIPPLRERPEDIPLLVTNFVDHFSRVNAKPIEGIDPTAVEILKSYSWPGNVRELKNIIERMVALNQEKRLGIQSVPEDIRVENKREVSLPLYSPGRLDDMEKECIRAKLEEVKGNKSVAAKQLGISRRTLYRKIDEYGIQ